MDKYSFLNAAHTVYFAELYEKYKNSFDIYKKRLNFQSAWIVE